MNTLFTPNVMVEFEKNAVNLAGGLNLLNKYLPHALTAGAAFSPAIRALHGAYKTGGKSALKDVFKTIDLKRFEEGGQNILNAQFKTPHGKTPGVFNTHELNLSTGPQGLKFDPRSRQQMIDAGKPDKYRHLKSVGYGVAGAAGLAGLGLISGAAAGAAGGLGN